MTIDDSFKALYSYYYRASSMHELVKRTPELVGPALDEAPAELRDGVLLLESHNALTVFYGLMFVVAEGLVECKVEDPAIAELLKSPHYDRLRRFRNAIFHYQPMFPVSLKQEEFMTASDSEVWAKSLWRELNRWFSDNIARPALTSVEREQ